MGQSSEWKDMGQISGIGADPMSFLLADCVRQKWAANAQISNDPSRMSQSKKSTADKKILKLYERCTKEYAS
jgi:hypothetical protein